jgi:TPR repeat protein
MSTISAARRFLFSSRIAVFALAFLLLSASFLPFSSIPEAFAAFAGNGLSSDANLASSVSPDSAGQSGQNLSRGTVTPEQAFSIVTAEAEGGDARALVTLGGFYAEGIGTPKNFSKARECYEKANQAGSAEGAYNVGVCWEVGMGSAADAVKAAEYFRRAADMKLPQALFKMSVILDSGTGVTRDEKASIGYMSRAAEAGHPDAAGIMGLVHLNGLRGQKKNAQEGMKMLNIAASAGNVEAMKNIAVVYKDGVGVKASPEEALKWYLIAEKCGYPAEALSAIKDGLMGKLTGEQMKKAESDANAWLKKARGGEIIDAGT